MSKTTARRLARAAHYTRSLAYFVLALGVAANLLTMVFLHYFAGTVGQAVLRSAISPDAPANIGGTLIFWGVAFVLLMLLDFAGWLASHPKAPQSEPVWNTTLVALALSIALFLLGEHFAHLVLMYSGILLFGFSALTVVISLWVAAENEYESGRLLSASFEDDIVYGRGIVKRACPECIVTEPAAVDPDVKTAA